MYFNLEITKKHNPDGAEMERVWIDDIGLSMALDLISSMFYARGHHSVLVTELGPREVAIYCDTFVGYDTYNRRAVFDTDRFPVYSGGFGFRLTPYSDEGDDTGQLVEMVTAYVTVYPELASPKVAEMIQNAKTPVA